MLKNTAYYRNRCRRLLRENDLDAIVFYADAYDDRFMKALTGTYSILQNYILLTEKNMFVAETRYLILDLEKRTVADLLPAESEKHGIDEIKKKLGERKRIGLIGACIFSDMARLMPASVVDLTDAADQIITYKSNGYIRTLHKYAKVLVDIMDDPALKAGMNQLEIRSTLHKQVIDNNFDVAFPICVTSGEDLKYSTAMPARNKEIRRKDIVCIDMGLKKDVYTTDLTRMYFLNFKEAEHLYNEIQKHHKEIINTKVRPEMAYSSIIKEYKQRLENYDQIFGVEELDFGHGIGFALHEKPTLETGGEVGYNVIFTLEPTIRTRFGKMRIEDMIAVDSRGNVSNLTVDSR